VRTLDSIEASPPSSVSEGLLPTAIQIFNSTEYNGSKTAGCEEKLWVAETARSRPHRPECASGKRVTG
jgi:hypothetical protein